MQQTTISAKYRNKPSGEEKCSFNQSGFPSWRASWFSCHKIFSQKRRKERVPDFLKEEKYAFIAVVRSLWSPGVRIYPSFSNLACCQENPNNTWLDILTESWKLAPNLHYPFLRTTRLKRCCWVSHLHISHIPRTAQIFCLPPFFSGLESHPSTPWDFL